MSRRWVDRGPRFADIPDNVFSARLPGGNLIAAVLDQQLMGWSDRGGASRIFGEQWADACAEVLQRWMGTERDTADGLPFVVECVVRLDDDPRIALQAGRQKLANPDFILYGTRIDGQPILQALDAKFSIESAKPRQVSAENLRALLEVEGSLIQEAVCAHMGSPAVASAETVRGVFLAPLGPLTDYFLPRMTLGPEPEIDPSDVVLLSADPVELFADVPVAVAVDPLARVDNLPVDPWANIAATVYYLRLACAAAWMWVEARTPLLSLAPPPSLDVPTFQTELRSRLTGAHSAYIAVAAWARDVERVARARKELRDALVLPIRMQEIRSLVPNAEEPEGRRLVKRARAALDRRFRERVIEEVGEVPASPTRPLADIVRDVRAASRKLEPELRQLVHDLIAAG